MIADSFRLACFEMSSVQGQDRTGLDWDGMDDWGQKKHGSKSPFLFKTRPLLQFILHTDEHIEIQQSL